MSSYDFIIDNIRFSYSAITTFETCPYAYKLLYIDKLPREKRVNNFYGEYGLLVHDCLENYFRGDIEIFEMRDYFENNYLHFIKSPPPPYPSNLVSNYYEAALDFFSNFIFDWDNFEVLVVEDKLDFDLFGYKFTGRPDLILKNKKKKENILLDFKTSKPFKKSSNGKEYWDKKKINGYRNQMYIYTYGYKQKENIDIDKMQIWFTRPSRKKTFDWNYDEEKESLLWAENLINKISKEEIFPYDNTNNYFCNYLCSAREVCEFRNRNE